METLTLRGKQKYPIACESLHQLAGTLDVEQGGFGCHELFAMLDPLNHAFERPDTQREFGERGGHEERHPAPLTGSGRCLGVGDQLLRWFDGGNRCRILAWRDALRQQPTTFEYI